MVISLTPAKVLAILSRIIIYLIYLLIDYIDRIKFYYLVTKRFDEIGKFTTTDETRFVLYLLSGGISTRWV